MRQGRRIEVDTLPAGHTQKRRKQKCAPKDRLIGCPVWWLRRVRPAVTERDQIVVAIYLWRRRIVCGRETFDVPNGELRALGVSRKIKYRTLELLATADLIKVTRRPGKAAPEVTILATG